MTPRWERYLVRIPVRARNTPADISPYVIESLQTNATMADSWSQRRAPVNAAMIFRVAYEAEKWCLSERLTASGNKLLCL
jgi:hypothetical protein